MRIGDLLYFSPNYRFGDLDFNDAEGTIEIFRDRVEGFYLQAVGDLLSQDHAFAAGVVCTAVIDLLARHSAGESDGHRFEEWLERNIPEFARPDPLDPPRTLARRIYKDFRCGLIHEGRIKRMGQFSLSGPLVRAENGVLIVNPKLLLDALSAAFDRYCSALQANRREYEHLVGTLSRDFEDELTDASSKAE